MSNRCKLQKEYYKKHGNYKGDGVYNDEYVKWLEDELIALKQSEDVVLDGVSVSLECEYCDGEIDNEDTFCKHCGDIM